MEAGALLALLVSSLLIRANRAEDFYGHSVTFNPPDRELDGSILLTVVSRENGRSSCSSQVAYSCESGVCGTFDAGRALVTDADDTGQNRWCQIEQESTTKIPPNTKSVFFSSTGCCWSSNTETIRDWTAAAQMDLGYRSDTDSINHCPVSATVASIRVPQNCFTTLPLLAHDPDGDEVKCRLTSSPPENLVLDENKCSFSSSGALSVGIHTLEVTLEDFPIRSINVSYPDGTVQKLDVSDPGLSPLCSIRLLFSLEVVSSLPSCEAGHVQPMFLSRTPSQDALLYASVGQPLTFVVEAQAHHNHIYDFQISGPHNMSKVFKDNTNGKAEVTLSWTPTHADLFRHVPVCFTAETQETQSEMRCVVITVTRSTITHGKANVVCKSNKMSVSLEIASMPAIDVNYLMLLDKSCSLTSNGTHIMGTMSFSACGTRVEDKGDYIVFSNEIDSFVLPTEVIIRRNNVRISFSCQFPKFLTVSTYFNVHQEDYVFTESAFGSFGYTFEIYKDENFTQKVESSEYPVQVKLLQKIYMSIQAQSDLSEVTLFVESCKATPDDNPDNAVSYYIIKDGCIKDETLAVKLLEDTTFNFQIEAFKFSGDRDEAYITCSVILCEKGNPFSRCSQGCVENANQARRRRRRGLSKETADHRITQGPFRFVDENFSQDAIDDSDEQSENRKKWKTMTEPNVTTTTPGISTTVEEEVSAPTTVTGPVLMSEVYDLDRGEHLGDYDSDDDYVHRFSNRRLRDLLRSNVATGLFAASFLVSVVVMAILVCHYTRKRRAEDMKMLLDTDDN